MSEPTELPRSRAGLVAGGFLALVAGVALVDLVCHLRAPDRWVEMAGTLPRRVSGEGFLGGGSMRWAEARAEESSTVANVLRPYWSELLYRVLHHTPARVVAGEDGWFYLASTLRALPDDAARIELAAAAVRAGELALRAQGIDTCVVLVPSKVTVLPEHLPPGIAAPAPIHPELLAALRARGTWAVDGRAPLETLAGPTPPFRPDDTHWSRAGSWRVTEIAAAEILARYPDLEPRLDRQLYEAELEHPTGDLLRMAGFRPEGALEESLRFAERQPRVRLEPYSGAMEVVATGDSFAINGITTHYLAGLLGTAVANRAAAGEGFLNGLATILGDLAQRPPHRVRLVVWVFVERQIRELLPLTYDGFLAALQVTWHGRWRPVEELEIEAWGPIRRVAPQRAVLPANGTSALRLDTRLARQRRAAAFPWPDAGSRLPFPSVTSVGAVAVRAGERSTWVPLLGPGPVGPTALLLGARELRAGETLAVELCTAYQPRRALAVEPVALRDGGAGGGTGGGGAGGGGGGSTGAGAAALEIALELDLGEPIAADGAHALGLVVFAPAGAGTLRVEGPDGAPVAATVDLVEGEGVYVLPLEEGARSALRRVRVVLGGGAAAETARGIEVRAADLLGL